VRCIDDIVLHRQDNNADGDYSDPASGGGIGGGAPKAADATYYHLTDVQFSTVAIIDVDAVVQERVTYSAYGRSRHHWLHDVDGDGDADNTDISTISTIAGGSNNLIGQASYRAECDLDRDGDVDSADTAIATGIGTKGALRYGELSSPGTPTGNPVVAGVDNIVGFVGYVFNNEVELYTVRFRWYSPELGRWLEKDPVGYVDGMHMFEYVRSKPLVARDPVGLFQDPGWVRLREIQMLEDLKKGKGKKTEECKKQCREFIIVQWPKDPDKVNWACWYTALPYPGEAIEGDSVESAVQAILDSLEEDECICSIQIWSHGWNGFFMIGDEQIKAEDFGEDSRFGPLKGRICKDDAIITVGACRSFNTDSGRELAEAMAAFFECRVAGYTETIGVGLRYPGYVELCPGGKATWKDGTGAQVKPKPPGKGPKVKTPDEANQSDKPCCPDTPVESPADDTPS